MDDLSNIKKINLEFEQFIRSYAYKIIFYFFLVIFAFIILRVYGILDFFNSDNKWTIFSIICLLMIILLPILFIKYKIKSYIKLPVFTGFDAFLLFSFFLLLFAIIWLFEEFLVLRILSIILVFGVLIAILLRIVFIYKGINYQICNNRDLYSLVDIYHNNFKQSNVNSVLIKDAPIFEDLLNREDIVGSIYNCITGYVSNEALTLSLVGKWGAGKSTLINLLLEKLKKNEPDKYKIISYDNFDAWTYGSNEALLYAMYDSILKALNFNISIIERNHILKNIASLTSKSSPVINASFLFSSTNSSSNDILLKEKKRMQRLLLRSNIVPIFVIDNLDRTSSENILFIIKMIGTFLNLPKIIYILAYEEERMTTILDNNIDKIEMKYIEKIIDQRWNVPTIDTSSASVVCYKCLRNTLSFYVEGTNIGNYDNIIRFMCNKISTLRELILIINSPLLWTFARKENNLDKIALLTVNIIQFFNPKLFSKIKENGTYFISKDDYKYIEREKYNKEGRDFFDNLKNDFGEYFILLKAIFPNVKRYLNNTELWDINPYSFKKDISSDKNVSIYSRKYFESYFTFGSTEYVWLNSTVKNFVICVNDCSFDIDGIDVITQKLNEIKEQYRLEFLVMLESYLEDVHDDKCFDLFKVLFKNYYKLDFAKNSLSLSDRERLCIILSTLCLRIQTEQLASFVSTLKNKWLYFETIEQIIYWLNADLKYEVNNNVIKKYNTLISFWEKVFENIWGKLKKEGFPNMYHTENYKIQNIWSVFRFYVEEPAEKFYIQKYIRSCLNENTVFNILRDMVAEVTSSNENEPYRYNFSKIVVEDFGLQINDIDEALINISPINDAEEFLLEVYNDYKRNIVNNKTNNEWHTGIVKKQKYKYW